MSDSTWECVQHLVIHETPIGPKNKRVLQVEQWKKDGSIIGRRKLRVRNYYREKDSADWKDGKSDGFSADEFDMVLENAQAIRIALRKAT